MKRSILSTLILATLGLGVTFSAQAVNYRVNLCAGSYEKDLTPGDLLDNVTVTMWGYSMGSTDDQVGPNSNGCAGPFTSPGPSIVIPDERSAGVPYDGLEIRLFNTLPRDTSLVIPGTVKVLDPEFITTGAAGLPRVKTFDIGNQQLDGSTIYEWTGLQPGSYMYHSGTNPQLQVQMGLYGAVINDVVAGSVAYRSGADPLTQDVTYTQDVVLFYSEVDRGIHDDVASPGPGIPTYDENDMQSTIGYDAKYFFVDVDETYLTDTMEFVPGSYEFNDLPAIKISPDVGADPKFLVRFFNASPRTHVPTVFDAEFDIIAEDGKLYVAENSVEDGELYPNARKQYTVELPALKTRDAFLNITGPASGILGGASFRLTDSAMSISNPTSTQTVAVELDASNEIANGIDNGMVLNIIVEPAPGYVAAVASSDAPVARRDSTSVPEGGTIDSILALALSNDSNAGQASVDILSYPVHGELISDGGVYRYEHDDGEDPRDSFVYALTNAAGESSSAGVVIDIAPVNDSPQANDDTVETQVGKTIEIRALKNDEDVDSESILITNVDNSELGSLTANDQVIVFEATKAGSDDVTYNISDSSGAFASAVLHLSVIEASGAATDSGVFGGGSTGGGSTGAGDPVGVAPEASEDKYKVARGGTLDTTSSIIVGLMANDSQGAKLNPTLVQYPEHGAIEVFENGTFIYTHDGSESGRDDFEYEIYNEHGSSTAEVKIEVTRK